MKKANEKKPEAKKAVVKASDTLQPDTTTEIQHSTGATLVTERGEGGEYKQYLKEGETPDENKND